MSSARIAVLASGGGSNLQAILDYLARVAPQEATVVLVATDRSNSGALDRAKAAGSEAVVTRSRLAPDAPPLEDVLDDRLDVIALAGYLQLIPSSLTRRFHGRIVNVHPAPLPAFGGAGMYGARVHRAVIAAHAPLSGPTVHFVDDQYDHGPTIAQWPVPVLPGDDEHALGSRVLRAEHLLYPRVVHALATGEIALTDDETVAPPFLTSPLPPFDPALTDEQSGAILDSRRR